MARRGRDKAPAVRHVNYRQLRNPFPPMEIFAADEIASMHETTLRTLQEVDPSGHFFATTQTMARYNTEFYQPIVQDYANFGTWTERGAIGANERATGVWEQILADEKGPKVDADRLADLQAYIAERTQAGGAPPES